MTSEEKKQWLIRRNKKNLKKRTRKKKHWRAVRRTESDSNRILKKEYDYLSVNKQFRFSPPKRFSLINNHEATAEFFNSLLGFIMKKGNRKKSIYIDISQITELTIDALMYLLAVINNLNTKFNYKYSVSGNLPQKKEIRDLITNAGFFNYVRLNKGREIMPNHCKETIQIVCGTDSNTEIGKNISDFVCKIAKVNKVMCSFLYDTLIELMSNTHKHAYDENRSILSPHWYCFAEYDNNDTISFSFVDTGAGIPATVRKRIGERLVNTKDDSYVASALRGENRSATGATYRGKGLPKIKKYCSEGKIKNMKIITNKADVSVYDGTIESNVVNNHLQGTLYYWQIKISDLRGRSDVNSKYL